MVIYIKTEYITLGQFLKFAHIASSGGEAKNYLLEGKIMVNGVVETRRGRKLYPEYTVIAENREYKIEQAHNN